MTIASRLAPLAPWLLLLSGTVHGQTTIWTASGTGNYSTGSNWGGGTSPGVPTGMTDAFIQNGSLAAPTIVNLGPGAGGNVRNLTLGPDNMLNVGLNSSLTVFGASISNDGALTVTGGSGTNSSLQLSNNVTLTGLGTVTLSYGDHNGNAFVEQSGGSFTLTNSTNTIQGDGVIGNGGLTFSNGASGTVNANVSGQTLLLNGSGGITNAGLLEATGGGILQLSANVANSGGTITAGNGTVDVSATITGGMLTTAGTGILQTNGSAVLDAVTIAGSSAYTGPLGSTTALLGTITNQGSVQLDAGSGSNTDLNIDANVTLMGGGTVTLNSGDTNGHVYVQQNGGSFTLTNVDNQIQGYGVIGNGGLSFTNSAGGTVNADASGQTLVLNGSGAFTNTGLLEATGGGILQISTNVANAGGGITASGGTVDVSATVTGGTLTTAGGGTLQTSVSAVLDMVTLAGSSAYTGPLGTTTTLLGTLTNQGNVQLNAGSGSNTNLDIAGNVTLQGGGTVTLNSGDTNGHVYVQQNGGSFTLTNLDNQVEGYGVIGNGGLAVVNGVSGIIDADVPTRTLLLNGSGGISNAGVLEATNGGTLQITILVDDAGGAITANGGAVLIDGGGTLHGATLTTVNGGTLGTDGAATLDGSAGAIILTSGSTYTGALGTTTTLLGTITNQGNIQLNAGSGSNNFLEMGSNVSLQGGGTVTLNNGDNNGRPYLEESGSGMVLTNVDNSINGAGTIGNGALGFTNASAGTVNADISGQTMVLNGSGALVNAGLLEATGGGILQISSNVANTGGTIMASSGTVDVGATVTGGMLTTAGTGTLQTLGPAVLDTVTITGSSAYTGRLGTTTTLLGTLTNQGNVQLNAGSGSNTNLDIAGNVTLQGGGTVTLNSGDANGSAFVQQSGGSFTLTNFNDTIEGYGIIGHGGLTLVNDAMGIIDANAPGQTLLLNGSGGVSNADVLEATNGGTLQITILVDDAGGAITANGGAVLIDGGGTLHGATLTTVNGGTLGTDGAATLDGSAGAIILTSGSTYTGALGTTTTLLGTITNQGNIQLNAGSGSNNFLEMGSNVSLQGGGTVTLNNGDNNGRPYLEESGSGMVLTNVDNSINGAGTIGNGALGFTNASAGTVNADISGQTMVLNGSGALVNAGLLEATGGGILQISSNVANTGGTIMASSGTVDVGATVTGGMLTTAGTGTLQTLGPAVLDTVTITGSSAYTGRLGTTTTLLGTLTNQGNVQLNAGSGSNTNLDIAGNVTLQGGGTVTLNSGDANGSAFVQQSGGSFTLTNVDNTIEGYGTIGNGGLSFLNDVAGLLLANVPMQSLQLNASGTATNLGTFQADDSTLSLTSSLTNFAVNTLTGGTWEASNGGTLSFDSPANAIDTNAATLVLNGPGSSIQTKTGAGGTYQQVEQTLTTNDGTLEVIGNRNFSGSNGLINNGVVQLGGGTLTAPSLTSNPGSVLSGFGTFSPAGGTTIGNGAEVSPGSAAAGQRIATLSFGTPLTFGPAGVYAFDLKNAPGAMAGTDYDTVSVSGVLSVTSTPGSPFSIAVESIDPASGNPGLANFNPAQPYSWTLVSAGSISGFNPADFSFNTSAFQNSLGGGSFSMGQLGNSLTLNFVPVPEPGTWALLLAGVAVVAIGARVRKDAR
jgi:hypothetical protein